MAAPRREERDDGERRRDPVELRRTHSPDASGQLRAEPVALGTVSGQRRRAVRLRLLRGAAPADDGVLQRVHGPAGRVARRPAAGVRHDQPVLAARRPHRVRTREERPVQVKTPRHP